MPTIRTYLELIDNMSSRYAKIEAAVRSTTAASEQLERAYSSSAGIQKTDALNEKLALQERALEIQGAKVDSLRGRYAGIINMHGKNSEEAQKFTLSLLNAETAEFRLREAANATAQTIERQEASAKAAAAAFQQAKQAQEAALGQASELSSKYKAEISTAASELSSMADYADGMSTEVFKTSEIGRYSAILQAVQVELSNAQLAQESLNQALSSGNLARISQAMQSYNAIMSRLSMSGLKAKNATDQLKSTEQQRIAVINQTKQAQQRAYSTSIYGRIKSQIMQLVGRQRDVTGAIKESTREQNRYTSSLGKSCSGADRLLSSIKSIAFAIMGAKSLGDGIEAVDNYTLNTARLGMVNDGLQTQEQLQNKIFQAAQRSRSSYDDMIVSVSKLNMLAGDSFKSNDEAIAFTELMNKAFKVSGASTQEASSAMYQLTQAMASGRLQGDEFKSIMENAPMVAQAIADYTGKGMESLKELSSEGLLSSDVIKNALFMAGDDIEKKFNGLPMTFSDAMTGIKSVAQDAFGGVMERISELLNSEDGQLAIQRIYNAIYQLAGFTASAVEVIVGVVNFAAEHWSTLEPIIWGIVGALAAWKLTQMAVKIAMNPIAAMIGAIVGAMFGLSVQSIGLEATILKVKDAFLTTWELIGITGAKVIWKVVKFMNDFSITIKAIGYGIQDFFESAVVDVLGTVQDMVNGVIGNLNGLIDVMNKIPGINISTMETVTWGTDKSAEYEENRKKRMDDLAQYTAEKEADTAVFKDAYDTMYKEYSDRRGERLLEIDDAVKRHAAKQQEEPPKTQSKNEPNYDGYLAPGALDEINKNTKDIKKSMDITKEDLKYIKDIAERKYINKYSTEIKVEMGGITNQINSSMDIDGVANQISDIFFKEITQTMYAVAEGAH